MTTETAKFQAGVTYFGRFITDYDSKFYFTVERRTASTVWLRDSRGQVKRRKIQHDGRCEYCLPFGNYSMSPGLYAEKAAQVEVEGLLQRIANAAEAHQAAIRTA